ncbi:MAG: type II toxin-antitoxin system RelE/ParE family toxin [Planctomycetaceae bacterium]|nr:type II toxin-antitoxin system RelE/ParE family toxin [Planctomycetaceae bacterium]
MDYEIVWTAEAKCMLLKIFDGLANDSTTVATSVAHSIYRKVQRLQESPQIGWCYPHTAKRDVRIMLFGHYRIAYEIHGSGYIVILGAYIVPCWSELATTDTFLQQRIHHDEVSL